MLNIVLPELLENVVDDSMVESEAHKCQVRLAANDPLVVRGDPELLRRAIENVLRNAIRFAPIGSAVEVTLENKDSAALISVRDYGPGVPEEKLCSLFKPFFRVESHRNRNTGGGVGLGLSIAERAVSLHQGKIAAANADPGLLVQIKLPLVESPVPVGM